jgi:gamma-glutamylcyclotransferase (GGCT)/AIG2-like uncharacterized protein YtfP
MTDFVFGYGSLVAGAAAPATIAGRRTWGVAMDNRRDLPGYKYYVLPDATRPSVYVAFLDLDPGAAGSVDGVCTPVDAGALAVLDRRERNYDRVEVTELVASPPGRVWAYVGKLDARERLARGRAEGSAVVSADYLRGVEAAYAAKAMAAPSLDPGDLPVWELRRIDLPPQPVGGG